MGILDNKSRVLDTIVTLEGRRQLSQGGLDIAYLSFTDNATFYKADVASGSQDATQRIFFESCQLPQDQITFRADDAGNVLPFGSADGIPQSPGKILSYTYTGVSGTLIADTASQNVSASRGQSFAGQADTLLASSADNFKRLRVISTQNQYFEDGAFGLGPEQVTFTITNNKPISDSTQYAAHISALDSIFSDPRFSNLPNFKYLPPTNKVTATDLDLTDHQATSQVQLAAYAPWGRTQVFGLSYVQVMHELQYYELLGYMRTFNFDPTSIQNTLVGQFFEKNFDTLRKLDVVDYGRHRTGNPATPTSHIFFVGKVQVDEKGTDTFLHLFTLVFE
jgi:hypothetical protein